MDFWGYVQVTCYSSFFHNILCCHRVRLTCFIWYLSAALLVSRQKCLVLCLTYFNLLPPAFFNQASRALIFACSRLLTLGLDICPASDFCLFIIFLPSLVLCYLYSSFLCSRLSVQYSSGVCHLRFTPVQLWDFPFKVMFDICGALCSFLYVSQKGSLVKEIPQLPQNHTVYIDTDTWYGCS